MWPQHTDARSSPRVTNPPVPLGNEAGVTARADSANNLRLLVSPVQEVNRWICAQAFQPMRIRGNVRIKNLRPSIVPIAARPHASDTFTHRSASQGFWGRNSRLRSRPTGSSLIATTGPPKNQIRLGEFTRFSAAPQPINPRVQPSGPELKHFPINGIRSIKTQFNFATIQPIAHRSTERKDHCERQILALAEAGHTRTERIVELPLETPQLGYQELRQSLWVGNKKTNGIPPGGQIHFAGHPGLRRC